MSTYNWFAFRRLTASIAWLRLLTLSALKMAETWILTVPSLRPSLLAISRLVLPWANKVNTRIWPGVMPWRVDADRKLTHLERMC